MKSTLKHRILFLTVLTAIVTTLASMPLKWLPGVALAATVTVNSTTDVKDGNTSSIANLIASPGADGVISLREAITAANNTSGADVINFNVPGGGVATIAVTAELPPIDQTLTIDGFTQPGSVFGAPLIELNGQNAGGAADGLRVGNNVTGCLIRGLVINRFSGNGIHITEGANGTKIQGNFIGTDATGNTALGNRANGIQIESQNCFVGTDGDGINDASEGNLVSGQQAPNDDGILITGERSEGNVVAGNRVGTNAAGTAALPNDDAGINLVGGTKRNRIGTNGDGVSDALEANLVAGHRLHDSSAGIRVGGQGTDDNIVAGNTVGTNASGTGAIPNTIGVRIVNGAARTILGTNGDGTGDTVEGNLISGNTMFGVDIGQATGARVAGNRIGTNATGVTAVPNGAGINIDGNSFDHFIGTNGDGTSDVAERNIISGNTGVGVQIAGNARRVVVGANFIGTTASGTASLPNGSHGVLMSNATKDHTIGGTAAIFSNKIAFNGGDGVAVTGTNTERCKILGNAIFENTGLGIDLGDDGVTPNDLDDADRGPNGFQNFPLLEDDPSTINGLLDSKPNTKYRIELFSNTASDPTGAGEGKTFVGAVDVTTNATGVAVFTFLVAIPHGTTISATATSEAEGTSEFSHVVMAPAPMPPVPTFTVSDAIATEPVSGTSHIIFTTTLSEPAPPAGIVLHFSTANQSANAGQDYNAVTNGEIIFAPGDTTELIKIDVLADTITPEPDETFLVTFAKSTRVVLGNPVGVGTILDNGPTAVRFDEGSVTRYSDTNVIEWRTGFEIDNLGFNVYREIDGERTLITRQPIAGSALIAAAGTALTAGKPYRWVDRKAPANAAYWLEDLDLRGGASLHGPFFPRADTKLGLASEVDSIEMSPLLDVLQATVDDTAIIAEGPPDALDSSAKQNRSFIKAARRNLAAGGSPAFGSTPADPSQLRALKLAVSRDGWYRASPVALLGQGKNDLDNLQLLTQGVEVPIRIGTDGMVEFYGQGLDLPSTDQRIYWLFVGPGPGLRIPQSSAAPPSQPGPASFSYVFERRDRSLYFSSLLNGDVENIFGPLIGGSSSTAQAIDLRAVDRSAPASLEVTVQGVTVVPHVVNVSLGGIQLGSIQFNGPVNQKAAFALSPGALVEGVNNITLQSSASNDVNLLDRVRITYSRFYRADANQLRFSVDGDQAARVTGFTTSSIRLLDITDPLRVQELIVKPTADGPGSFAVGVPPAPGTRTFLAIATAGRSPVAETNEPSSLKASTRQADLLVISHREFMSILTPLVDMRRSQGLRVEVVDVEDVFDEFSFGVHTPDAIRDFLNFTRSHWRVAPQFVLLVGDSTWDPRNYLGLGPADFVPTRLIDTTFMETASDDWFADFNSDGLPEMALGRLPVRTAAQCDVVVKKIISSGEPPDPQSPALFVADYGFEWINSDLSRLLPPTLPLVNIDRSTGSDSQVRARILGALNSGARIVNFSGHGSVTVWTGAGLLTAADAPLLSNTKSRPLMLMLTCLNGYSHDAIIQSLGEALLLAPNGASAVWSSTGMTVPGSQRELAMGLLQRLSEGTSEIGKLMIEAKAATTDRDVRRTWILLGDPSMKFTVNHFP